MSSRTRQTTQDTYKLWRSQDRQAESDSERPRHKATSTSQTRSQGESRNLSSSRGYQSDAPPPSQHRAGTSTSKTLHHPTRPSVTGATASRSQQPTASSSSNPNPYTQSAGQYQSRPSRPSEETPEPRSSSHRRIGSTPALQPSADRVSNIEDHGKSRAYTSSRGQNIQAAPPIPEVWLPPKDSSSLSKRYKDRAGDKERERERDQEGEKDRERERDKEREKDREKEKGRERERDRENRARERDKEKLRAKEIQKEQANERERLRSRDRDRVAESSRNPTDQRTERDMEKRDEVYREAYRDPLRERERVRERQEKYVERRGDGIKEGSREARASKTPTPLLGETRTASSGHRRYKSEDTPSTSTPRRPLNEEPTAKVSAPPQSSSIQQSAAPHTNVIQPTPQAMPVHLPVTKQPYTQKPHYDRTMSAPTTKDSFASDNEQASRRDMRVSLDQRPASAVPTARDHGPSRPPGEYQSDATISQGKSKISASIRSMFTRNQVPPTPSIKPSDLIPDKGRITAVSSLLVQTTDPKAASTKQQFISIFAGQGPSDIQELKPAKTSRDGDAGIGPTPLTKELSNARVQDRIKAIEALQTGSKAPATVHNRIPSVDPSARTGHTSKEPANQTEAIHRGGQIRGQAADARPSPPEAIVSTSTLGTHLGDDPVRRARAIVTPKPAVAQLLDPSSLSRPTHSRQVRFDVPASAPIEFSNSTVPIPPVHFARSAPDVDTNGARSTHFLIPLALSAGSSSRHTYSPESPALPKLPPVVKEPSPPKPSKTIERDPPLLSNQQHPASALQYPWVGVAMTPSTDSHTSAAKHSSHKEKKEARNSSRTALIPTQATALGVLSTQLPHDLGNAAYVHPATLQIVSHVDKASDDANRPMRPGPDTREVKLTEVPSPSQGLLPSIPTAVQAEPPTSNNAASLSLLTSENQAEMLDLASALNVSQSIPPQKQVPLQQVPLPPQKESRSRRKEKVSSGARDPPPNLWTNQIHPKEVSLAPAPELPAVPAAEIRGSAPQISYAPSFINETAEPDHVVAVTLGDTAGLGNQLLPTVRLFKQDAPESRRGRPKYDIYASVPETAKVVVNQDSYGQPEHNEIIVLPALAQGMSARSESSKPVAQVPGLQLSSDTLNGFERSKSNDVNSHYQTSTTGTKEFSASVQASASVSVEQLMVNVESSRPRRGLLNEDSPPIIERQQSKRDLESRPEGVTEGSTVLGNRVRDDNQQVYSTAGSHAVGPNIERSHSTQPSIADVTTRTLPSKSWYQSSKAVETRPSRPLHASEFPQHRATYEPNVGPFSQPPSSYGPTQATEAGQNTGRVNQAVHAPAVATFNSYIAASGGQNGTRLEDTRPERPSNDPSTILRPKDEHQSVDYQRLTPQDTRQPTRDRYRSEQLAPVGRGQTAPQDAISRFPVVEEQFQRPGVFNRSERVKFTYAPSVQASAPDPISLVPAPAPVPALAPISVSVPVATSTPTAVYDPHEGLLSPLQQAIRAPPTPQVQYRTFSRDAQLNDPRLWRQPDAQMSQQIPPRSHIYAPTPTTAFSSLPAAQPPLNSLIPNAIQHNNMYDTNPPSTTQLNDTTTNATSRLMPTSTYPSSTYPHNLYRTEQFNSSQTTNYTHKDHPPDTSFNNPSDSLQSITTTPNPPQPAPVSRASDFAHGPSVSSYVEPASTRPGTSVVPPVMTASSNSTSHRSVSLANHPSQPTISTQVPIQKSSQGSIRQLIPSTPPGSVHHLRSDSQQATPSTRAPVSGYLSTPAPQPRLLHQPSRTVSNESILMTPSSLAPSMLPPTNYPRAPPMAPVTRHESRESRESTKKKGFFNNMFAVRSKTPTQPHKSYEMWYPNSSEKTLENSNSQTSLPSSGKGPVGSTSKQVNTASQAPQRRVPPILVDIPIKGPTRKEPEQQRVFSAFKILHTKRNRTMSHASMDATDGQTQTATNTVVGSPTQSTRSGAPFLPPPQRDPLMAAQEWARREEVENRPKDRRRRPGVTWDMDEDPPEPAPGTAPKKKLSRRRQ